jgi:hypothetical protein
MPPSRYGIVLGLWVVLKEQTRTTQTDEYLKDVSIIISDSVWHFGAWYNPGQGVQS